MKKFATALNCMDGRAQLPIIEKVKELSGAEFVDMVTEAGIEKIISQWSVAATDAALKTKIDISVEKHGSGFIAVVAHYDCAGNAVDEATHKAETRASRDILQSLYPELTVIGIWLDEEFKANIIED